MFVSSGHADVAEVMKDGGVSTERLIIDNRALDTVRELERLLWCLFCQESLTMVFGFVNFACFSGDQLHLHG